MQPWSMSRGDCEILPLIAQHYPCHSPKVRPATKFRGARHRETTTLTTPHNEDRKYVYADCSLRAQVKASARSAAQQDRETFGGEAAQTEEASQEGMQHAPMHLAQAYHIVEPRMAIQG
jgi:hypothetical protein